MKKRYLVHTFQPIAFFEFKKSDTILLLRGQAMLT